MPYLILREAEPNGNKVVVSGLKGIGKINDHMHLQYDNNAIWFLFHACRIATALAGAMARYILV